MLSFLIAELIVAFLDHDSVEGHTEQKDFGGVLSKLGRSPPPLHAEGTTDLVFSQAIISLTGARADLGLNRTQARQQQRPARVAAACPKSGC